MRSKDRRAGRVTLIAAALSLVPLVLIAAAAWDVWRLVPVIHERSQAVRQLIGRIDHLDEALTSSAMLAAATGDPQWEARYADLDGQIHAAIDSLTVVTAAVGQPGSAPSVRAVEDSLHGMERRALELVRRGESEAAWALLVTPEIPDPAGGVGGIRPRAQTGDGAARGGRRRAP